MRYRTGSDMSPVITLIIISGALFLATLFSPGLVILLGLQQPSQLLTHPWTLVTNLFIHAGWGHIITNMLTLYFFGTFLLNLVGQNMFLLIYFGAGIAGNILLLLLYPIFPFFIAVGASGAIFGLGGTLTALRPKVQVYVFPIPAPIPLWVSVIGGFVIISFVPGVAWQGHLGGLLLGLIAGWFLKRKRYYY